MQQTPQRLLAIQVCKVHDVHPWVCGRAVRGDAHERWAAWAAQALQQQLGQQLSSDSALTASAPLRGWQETVIPQVPLAFHSLQACGRSLQNCSE